MLRSFRVKNFRCFPSLTIGPLERVNLITGKNNTGKTALLEAIYLHSHPQDCDLPFAINRLRGGEQLKKYDGDIGSWLFYDKHAAEGLELTSDDDQGRTRSLRMWMVDGPTARARFPEAEEVLQGMFRQNAWGANQPHLILKAEAEGKQYYSVGVPTQSGLASVGSKLPWEGPCTFIRSESCSPEKDVEGFSELEAANRQEVLLRNLRVLEPRLRRLSLLSLAGKPVIHGDIGFSRLVPLALMGVGVRRLLSIVIAIANAPAGTVLIDEFENGLHYSVLKQVWQALACAAHDGDVQVFATTHSWECIRAADEAFSEREVYDLHIYRLDRFDDQVTATAYDHEMIEAALTTGLEIR